MEDANIIAGILAAILAISATIPYIITVLNGRTKPHAFSWFIWFLINVIAFSAQLVEGAGPGAWVTLTSGLAALFVFCMALRIFRTLSVTRTDWISLGLALSGIPLWLITKEPMTAAIMMTFVNLMAYVPTLRKAWTAPESENGLSFILHTAKWVAGIAGLASLNLTTILYPAIIGLANAVTVFVIYYRRASIKK